jgi:hypothetical protein
MRHGPENELIEPAISAEKTLGVSVDKLKPNITGLLRAFQGGDSDALNRLLPLVYDELRKIAGGQVRGQRHASVQPTELAPSSPRS